MIFHRGLLKSALEPIRELLREDWDWLKRDYPDHLREPLSLDMCRLSTAYLLYLFGQAGLTGWTPREGVPFVDEFDADQVLPRGGMLTKDQRWAPHTWLEHDQGWILDLTADQFGYSEIIIAKSNDPRYRHNLPHDQVMERIHECSLSVNWYKYQTEELGKKEILSHFFSTVVQASQLDMRLSSSTLSL
jgi:hypothetical protein